MTGRIQVRLATPRDADVIAWHRARMFQDMGQLSPDLFEPLGSSARDRLTVAPETGEYVGWLASAKESPDTIVAGAGVQLRQVFPHPRWRADGSVVVAGGRHARNERLDRLVLHASVEGRPLFDRLGLVPTNEMRLADPVSPEPAEGVGPRASASGYASARTNPRDP